MATFKDCTFSGGIQELDGNVFDNCKFENTQMFYRGGQPPSFDKCNFVDSPFIFDGPAGNTVLFLQAMSRPKSGVSKIVREMFPTLTDK